MYHEKCVTISADVTCLECSKRAKEKSSAAEQNDISSSFGDECDSQENNSPRLIRNPI